jgi:hypothetical protein
MNDVYVSPYEWVRRRGKRDLGLRAPVFMRVVVAWASHGWANGEGKGGPESKSKRDSAHASWSKAVLQTSLLSEVERRDGKQGCVFIYLSSCPAHLMDGKTLRCTVSMEESLPLEFRYFFTAEVSCDDPHPPTKWLFEGRGAKASLTSTVYGFIHPPPAE